MSRQVVSGYVGRSVSAAELIEAVANSLGVPNDAVAALDSNEVDPVAYVEVLRESGEYPTRVTAFVDDARVPVGAGKRDLIAVLARQLGASLLYDDGTSTNPYRWVRVDPDGRRYEVFDDPASETLRIDPAHEPLRIDEELEWEQASLDSALATMVSATGQPAPAVELRRLAELRRVLTERQRSPRGPTGTVVK